MKTVSDLCQWLETNAPANHTPADIARVAAMMVARVGDVESLSAPTYRRAVLAAVLADWERAIGRHAIYSEAMADMLPAIAATEGLSPDVVFMLTAWITSGEVLGMFIQGADEAAESGAN
jgi:hypothetical protein